MSSKKLISYLITGIIFVILLQSAIALTASIGNSRMILRAGIGEEVTRYILVKNVNNESVDINITASGDLVYNVNIQDNYFILKSGEEKKAYFTIKADKENTTETKINVRFTPKSGSPVGLSSTVILIAGNGGAGNGGNSSSSDVGANSSAGGTGAEEYSNNNSLTKSVLGGQNNTVLLLLATPLVLILILVVLVIFSKKRAIKPKGRFSPYEKE